MLPFYVKKIGCSRIFDAMGRVIPVTLLEVQEPVVMRKRKTEDKVYLQLGYASIKEKSLNKAKKGQFEKIGVESKKFIREFEVDSEESFDQGQVLDFSELYEGKSYLDVTGVSKGKGFCGVIKRHGFSRGPETHGSRHHREPGAMSFLDLARVMKGKKLPGRKGGENVTVQNVKIVTFDKETKLLYVKGAVPGANKSYLVVKTSVKKS